MILSKGFVYCLKCKEQYRINISEVLQSNVIEKYCRKRGGLVWRGHESFGSDDTADWQVNINILKCNGVWFSLI